MKIEIQYKADELTRQNFVFWNGLSSNVAENRFVLDLYNKQQREPGKSNYKVIENYNRIMSRDSSIKDPKTIQFPPNIEDLIKEKVLEVFKNIEIYTN